MRLRNEDYTLLKRVHWELVSGGKAELAAAVQDILTRFEEARNRTREHNRANARANREAGYAWKSAQRPKRSKYYPDGKEE